MPEHFSLGLAFILLSLFMIGTLSWATGSLRVGAIFLAWATFASALALSGWTNQFQAQPPRIVFVLVPLLIFCFLFGLTRLSDRFVQVPVRVLIMIQAFRILVEILIHWAVESEIAPPQLTWPNPISAHYSGMNIDILAGLTAPIIAFFYHRLPRWAVLTWNAICLVMVLWVVAVAIASVPTPFQILKPDNTWVAFFPFILLPTVLVPIAISGHLVIFRAVLSRKEG